MIVKQGDNTRGESNATEERTNGISAGVDVGWELLSVIACMSAVSVVEIPVRVLSMLAIKTSLLSILSPINGGEAGYRDH
jgi:hypothetical protein